MSGKLLNRLRVARDYFLRKPHLCGGPIEITLESTAKCNLYCPMCPRHVYTFDNENMDLDLYRKIVEQARDHVEFVWPYGIGEPMIHPRIFDMIRIARDAGIWTGISTNATLLDERRTNLLFESGLDYVILAFDGATKETYEKYRIGANYEKVRGNIQRFLDEKLRRKSRIFVVLQMVMLSGNHQEVQAYRRLWSTPGVDEIRFKRDEVQISEVAIQGDRKNGQRHNPCHLLWRGPLYIRYDAKAFPCCYMYDDPPVGDLKQESLMDVWNGPAMIKLREAHISGDLSAYPTCMNCQAARPSLPAFYGSLIPDGLTVRKFVPAMEKLSRFYQIGVFEKEVRSEN